MSNEFVAFATAEPGTANTLSPASLAALTALLANGFQPGIALSEQVNTVLRQATTVSAAMGKFTDDFGPSDALDNGDPAAFCAAFKAAIDAIISGLNHWRPGDIKATGATDNPAGWLYCNGAWVSRTTYAALFAAIGHTYQTLPGPPPADQFQLPDLRGEFIRGWDDGRGADPGRGLGDPQADEIRSHTHPLSENILTEGIAGSGPGGETSGTSGVPVATGATGGAETRPRNVTVRYLIKI